MKIALLLSMFILSGCFEPEQTPEAALKEFVESRMGKVVNREAALDRLTGPMKASLENVSNEEFQQFADMRNIRQDSFKVLSKSCQSSKCSLTYAISYQNGQLDKATFKSEVKKIAELQLSEGKWLISEVSNIKTYHEALQPINALDDQAP